ncbi:XRE family transcriptional regulator [Paenibacillus barcinonensis]|uniref:XRE family transcriptional regulator n=1 Tax=Paenibacillus barcinonensis TaxID=198119 RepID=A0ABX6Q0U2_PAEBA|nr:XRE family transcriptional regulator [Paenibacillus barcinonensis]QKS55505.1 XRE family transcriptional regulator [Paenibacillus barcinonensis]
MITYIDDKDIKNGFLSVEVKSSLEVITQKSIREELLNYIEENQMLVYHFAEISGINSGTLSRFINGSQLIPIKALDRMTYTMGLEEGTFYDLYVDELLIDPSTDWRRLRPFLIRCSQLNKLTCIEKIVDLMLEKSYYISSLFDFAESLYEEGNTAASLLIYKKVSEGERYQHAERLAVCQYRIFKLSLGDDQQHNYELALVFEPFVKRLSESEQLDALKDLANLYLSLRLWEKAKELSTEMGRLARIQYEQKHKRTGKKVRATGPKKMLFGYILYSHVLLGTVADETGQYNEAFYHLEKYVDHSWIVESGEIAEQTKQQFLVWATANRLLYRVMTGETDLIDAYVDSLANNEDEILLGLFKVVKAALKYSYNIDHILERYHEMIQTQVNSQKRHGSYTSQLINDRFVIFLADIAEYYNNSLRPEIGIIFVLESLAISAKINNDAYLVRSFCLFEKMRHVALHSQLDKYQEILREVELGI